ncbi:MAG: chemotaxis protein CheD [Deltaproteobacteria bacterium]|nr:chemotaxis protein CheD [Deltaproteobacteria bacterium]
MSGRDHPLIDYHLPPGHIYVGHEPSLIWTVLGSCVAVSLWDSLKLIGGMVHFLYPLTADSRKSTAEYGNVAVRCLVKMFLDDGALEENLRAQIFGGAISDTADCAKIAQENLQMARMILKRHHIAVASEDTGGHMGRKIVYNTGSNETIVYKVNAIRQADWYPYVDEGK